MSHFNQIANRWDDPEKIKMMEKLAKETKKILHLTKKVKLMDFGCGTGLFGLEFFNEANSITGVDTSEGMLAVFDEKTKKFPFIKSLQVDLETNSLDEKFDLIISSMAFHHLNAPLSVLKKLTNYLNSSGKIAIVDLDKEDGSFHPDNATMGVKHFGFSKEELLNWSKSLHLNFEYHIINSIEKNEKQYHQFLAVFTN